jgi:RNA polymerase sigma-70 factor, ECF subfamily
MATVAVERHVQQSAFGCWTTQSDLPAHSDQSSINEFEHLYLTYRSRVWALCLRMTGNPDEAEDLTQETFIRMFQNLNTFRGESAFCTWLRRITINVVLLRFQKASWRRERSLEELTGPDPMTGCPHKMEFGRIDSQLEGTIDRVNLQRAIDQLPPGLKAVFILHDIEGYAHFEISGLMGWSVGTSKSQLHKARHRLRELLDEAPPDESAVQKAAAGSTPGESEESEHVVLQFPHTMPQTCPTSASEAA